jgi:hypothetical protein
MEKKTAQHQKQQESEHQNNYEQEKHKTEIILKQKNKIDH